MKNFEAFKKFKQKIAEAGINIPKLKDELLILKKKQPALDLEANKAKYLEEKGWHEKAQKAEENKKAVGKLQTEIEETEKGVEVLKEELKRLEDAALSDIRRHYRPLYEEAARKLLPALKQAFELEKELIRIAEEARGKANQVTPIGLLMVPPLNRLLVERDGEVKEYAPFHRFVKDAEQQGIRLEG